MARDAVVRRRHPAAVIWVTLTVLATVVPILYLASVSLMGRDDLASGVLFSPNPQWGNWPSALIGTSLVRGIAASFGAAVAGTALTLAFALPGAWAIVRYRTGGRTLANLLMSPWLLPPIVAVVPLFFLLRVTGLLNSLIGLTLVYALVNVPVAIWLLEGFLRRIPGEIDEAAQLDGAGSFRVLVAIVTPLVGPALLSIGVIVAILNYNEFLLATFFIQDPDQQTLPVVLSLFYGDRIPHLGRIAAASLAGVVPIFLAALILQRRLLGGLAAAAH